jgi:hypothetical protein
MVFLLVVWRKNCSTLFYTYFLLLFSGKAEIQISLRNYTCFCSISAASMCKHSKNDFFTFSWRFQTGIFQTSYLLATQSALLPHIYIYIYIFLGSKGKIETKVIEKDVFTFMEEQ